MGDIPLLEDPEGAPYPEEVQRLHRALVKINRVRSNVIATQNCSWSNTTYPLVAILNEAGYDLEGATPAQQVEHTSCYGGAGGMPTILDHPEYVSRITDPTQRYTKVIHAAVVGIDKVVPGLCLTPDPGSDFPPFASSVAVVWFPDEGPVDS